ncbi:protein-disulfide reductase DsbD family protein [Kordiimonas pumila]|uniref:Protein-disulfide reductase DsbD family protein n=1 Tax=Kordiimonas pumila TaxID=2161677 RepID=A0ABV7D1X3_9PROT|nr:thioredoxin family protein [Kordiimonas pumila]
MAFFLRLFCLGFAIVCSSTVFAKELLHYEASHSTLSVDLESNGFQKGQIVWLAVQINPTEGWHTYWENYGDSGAAPVFEWSVPKDVTVGKTLFPAPERIPVGPLANYGYHGRSTLLVPLNIGSEYSANDIPISLSAEWLVCDIECIPQYGDWSFTLEAASGLDSSAEQLFAQARSQIPEDSYWQSKIILSNKNNELRVYIDKKDLGNIQEVYFYPLSDGLVSYSAKQDWQWVDDSISINLPKEHSTDTPINANGVLYILTNTADYYFNLQPSLDAMTVVSTDALPSTKASVAVMPLWQVFVFAVIGGIILNLMPCVFPVLSLKAIALVSANYKSRKNRILEGWVYSLGIWVSFMAIVFVLVLIRAGGNAIGWGFQLQSPLFVGLLAILMVIVALSLFGIFYIRLGIEGAGQSLTVQDSLKSTFFKGVLATLVATPCTAPFMAPAIGYALSQPTPIIFAVFTALAFGLALPFLILSYSDKAANLMPKPGPWMEKLKQGLGFPMLLTACWLVYVYNIQAGSDAAFILLVVITSISFALWLWYDFQLKATKTIAILITGLALYGFITVSKPVNNATSTNSEYEQTFTEARLKSLLDAEKPVFAYFTAEWCITCKVNERVALKTDRVQQAFAEKNITVLKGDWTNRNEDIASVLARYGRAGVPLYLYFPAGSKDAVLLPEILSPAIVIEHLK